jgi:predicted HicB family RNase H-like nuclease
MKQMKPKNAPKRYKTFPLQMADDLHKALKHKALESDQTLHAYIIEALTTKVREELAHYAVSGGQAAALRERRK